MKQQTVNQKHIEDVLRRYSDAVVTFAALSEPTIRAITEAELKKLGQRDELRASGDA